MGVALGGKKKFEQAACVYAGGKLLLSILVFFFLCETCHEFGKYMFYTTIRVLLITHFIYIGFRSTAKILAAVSACRSLLYLINFFTSTLAVQVPFLDVRFNLFYQNTGSHVFLVNSAVTAAVAFFLIRAAWSPALKRQKAEPIPSAQTIDWTDDALRAIRPAPFFAKKFIEKRARAMGIKTITPEALDEIKGY